MTYDPRMVATFSFVSGIAAILALVFIAIFFAGVPIFGPLNDIALLVMALAAFPVVHWLGGGRPVTWVAHAGLATWSVLHALMIVRLVDYDSQTGRSWALVVSSLGLAVFGGALVAILLTGAPVSGILRWIGIVAGAGFVVMGVGIPAFGTFSPLTYVGGLAWQLGWPVFVVWLARNLVVASTSVSNHA
jgi:hypothetical protein